ncbi:lipopolysaccharide biosynthesis protein, partial [Escherichia coli]|nr:lipopolysaccharide biosynthesis protein [Escherichia coli]
MFWRGVLGYLPVNIVQGLTGLLTIVVFTRVLAPADYGAYALAFSVMTLVHTGVFTWLEAAMARFYAAEAQAGRLPDHFATLYRA